MKKKISSKKCIALVLAMVMIITSIPFMMFSAATTGAYDPAPYWGDGSNNAAVNTNFVATLNADGSLSVAFPHANAAATWNTYSTTTPTKKTISNYIMTITRLRDDGSRKEIWSENFNLNSTDGRIGTFTVDNTEGNEYPNSIYYWPGAFTSLGDYEVDASYDVSIQAVDSDGWVSDKIHTLLTETPYYIINDDFSPNESWVVREMLLFEQKGTADVDKSNSQSNGGATSPDYSERQSAELIDVNGKMDGMGYNGSAGYRLWIANAYNGTPYVMTTTWSRDHYDFTNAEEIWFYVDLSRVQINKFAFTLSANEKSVEHWRDDTTNYTSHYGVTFSTATAGGKNTGKVSEGIYIQNADGLWESTSMTDGYFTNLSGYKGFVRIPIKYFILQSDQYIVADNDMTNWESEGNGNANSLNAYANKHYFTSGSTMIVPDSQGNTKTLSTTTYNSKVAFKVNDVGTSIKDALIVYNRTEKSTRILQTNTHEMGPMISDANVVSVSGTTYTVTDPQFAIEDLVSAGVQVADWTAESVHKSFYIDQVMFCKKNIGSSSDFDANGYVLQTSSLAFPAEVNISNNNSGTYGIKMSSFYDRTKQVPKAVAEYILQYFGEIPSLNDITAKKLVDDIILNYIECFGISKGSSLSDENKVSQAIEKLTSLGYTEAYNRYKDAERFINYINSENSDSNFNAVVYFENTVEGLQSAEFANHTDVELQKTLKQLMAIYETFNLSHFELLGKDTEEKFLELYDLVMGEEVKTGQSIGAYPFIPFNDFETNYSYGQLSDLYHDDINRENNKPIDINSTGNFTTYVSDGVIDQPGEVGGTAIGWSPKDYRPTGEKFTTGDKYFSRMDAQITNNGFADSLGITMNLNGNLVCDPENSDWKIATVSTTYLGAEADTWGNIPGLDLSGIAVKTNASQGTEEEVKTRYGEGVIPNSFVMYVDFSEVSNLNFNVKFILSDTDGNDVNCYFCAGKEGEFPVIYLLDKNGEWEKQQLKITQTDIEAAHTFYREVDPGICTIAPSELNTLQGYKGFIRIPLTCFRIPTDGGLFNADKNFEYLDNILDDGYTIKQAKISVWDESGNNEGKKIVIDGLGFTYDPKCQNRVSNNTNCNGELNQDNGIYITNMDEYFGVKTVDSSNFEKMVATVDPYATEAEFKASFDACIQAYLALSDYQKTIPEVKYCYDNLLEAKYRALYTDYTNEIKKEKWQPLYVATTDSGGNVTATAVENLLTALGTVSEKAKEYSTTDETLLDLYDTHKDDYLTALGFTSIEDAQSVVDMYEKGYHRLSMSDRALISDYDFGRLTNAYNAAKRAILIGGDADVHEGVEKDGIIANVETFKNNITDIYTASTHLDADVDRIPDTEDDNNGDGVVDNKDKLKTVKYAGKIIVKDENGNDVEVNALEYYTDMYADISVFGKKLLSDDTDIAAAYMNMYDAAEAIHDNSTPITPNAGAMVEGGIITYERRLENAYMDVSPKIMAKTVLDTATLNEIEYCLGQYEALLRRYALVDELNYDYAQLALLVPCADIASVDSSNTELTTITLNNNSAETMKYTAYIDLSYIATRLNRSVDLYAQSSLKWTQSGGSTYKAFEDFMYNNATAEGLVDYQNADGVVTALVGSYANGNSASLGKYEYTLSVDATEAAKVPTGATYTGKVTFYAVDSAVVAEKTADGTDVSTVLADPANVLEVVEVDVVFQSTNGTDPIIYEVEIPAMVQVGWDDSSDIEVSYSVEATLGSNTLSVGVSNDGKDMLINDDTGITYELTYSKVNFGTETFTGDVADGTKPTDAPSITVTGWNNVPVGTYTTQLTYTVDITSS